VDIKQARENGGMNQKSFGARNLNYTKSGPYNEKVDSFVSVVA